ncbi:MAG TPA: hypothetical protein VD833_00985 [Vicinamibacterales bacterium]|nr:hypothetical protein [Vicinamibacterales bacterium]
MLRKLSIPIPWTELVRRTISEVVADNCLGMAAHVALYFAFFPAPGGPHPARERS